MGTSFEDLQARRKPREKSIAVVVSDGDLVEQIDQLEAAMHAQKHLDETLNEPNKAPKMQAELEELRKSAAHMAETFTFRELSRPAYRDLMASHPSKEKGLRWNEDTFAPALLAATCTSHGFTEVQWKEIWDGWGAWATAPLFGTAYNVCEQPSRVPFGLRSSDGMDDSEPNSVTAPSEASDIPSS